MAIVPVFEAVSVIALLPAVLLVGSVLSSAQAADDPYTLLLGVAQDAGHPQAGCQKVCCAGAWEDPTLGHRVVSLAVVDPASGERWLIDASPDFRLQLRALDEAQNPTSPPGLSGIFLTHGHMGHYTGLVHLGREAMGTRGVAVHAMPRMEAFLRQYGPWEQLVRAGNVELKGLADGQVVSLNDRLSIEPFSVPHRDEYTETVGFVVQGPNHRVLYLPDIDKWERWDRPIESLLVGVDRAYVDGTFFSDGELPNRAMSEIPHPFVVESLARFAPLPAGERSKIRFIHFNHTNPLLQADSNACKQVEAAGFQAAEEGERFGL